EGRGVKRLHRVTPESEVKLEETADKKGWSSTGWVTGTGSHIKASEEYTVEFAAAIAAAVVAGLSYVH
ncbi:unnamed protein product, partial [Prorocentrum cordatum]